MDLAEKIYTSGDVKLTDSETLFNSYIKSLVELSPDIEAKVAETTKIQAAANSMAPPPKVKIVSTLLSLYQLCCVRIFDNYNFVINNIITNPTNPIAGLGQQQPPGGGGKKKL